MRHRVAILDGHSRRELLLRRLESAALGRRGYGGLGEGSRRRGLHHRKREALKSMAPCMLPKYGHPYATRLRDIMKAPVAIAKHKGIAS
eukprot:scaffold154562_cov24-Tisochrysis_lutea.AAC.1